MTDRDPEWESERFGGDDERIRRERAENRRLQEELGDDEQNDVESGLWERAIEDPPQKDLDVAEQDDSGDGLGITREVAQERRRGESGADPAPSTGADEEDDGPEGEGVHITRNP